MDTSPLAIILVKNGSRGDRLLFKYPFATFNGSTSETKDKKRNPYSLTTKGHFEDPKPKISSASKGNLSNFSDKVLSNLLAMKRKQCRTKFELKVDDVRFVGHPVNLEEGKELIQKGPSIASQGFSIAFFNIVFALKTTLSHDIVTCYYDLSTRLGIALSYEERRCKFLSREAKIMLNIQDEMSQQPESSQESCFEVILEKSLLAKHLRQIYLELCQTGQVMVQLNNWMDFSFCLPPRIPNAFGTNKRITNEALKSGLKNVKPYHTFLLCVDKQELLHSLPPDASPALRRLLYVESPVSTFYTLAADADLTLNQVLMLAGHLVYWGKAIIIYPVCNTNVYVLSPEVQIGRYCKLAEEFQKEFPGQSYHQTLAQFSLPISLWHMGDPMSLPTEQQLQKQTLLWFLKHGLLQQLHTYVYIAPTTVTPKPKAGLSSSHSSTRSQLATVSEAISERPFPEAEELELCEGTPRSRTYSMTLRGNASLSSKAPSQSDFQKGVREDLRGPPPLKESTQIPHFYLEASSEQEDSFKDVSNDFCEATVDSLSQKDPSQTSNLQSLQTPSESDVGSVGSDDRSLSPGVVGAHVMEEDALHNLNTCLTPLEKEMVLIAEAAKNVDDLKVFARLCPYFRGEHHLEEMMYRVSLHRSHLLEVIDKFKAVLVTAEHADHSILFNSEKC